MSDEKILEAIHKFFDARPGVIMEQFSLTKPTFRYSDTTVLGHFGREECNFPWEKLDKVEELKEFFGF